MGEEGKTESGTNHPLVEKALASRPAVAQLIGFNVEEVNGGRAVGCLETGPQHANPMGATHGGVLCDLADAAMGMALCVYPHARRVVYYYVAKHQLLSACLASATPRKGARSEPREEHGLCRV